MVSAGWMYANQAGEPKQESSSSESLPKEACKTVEVDNEPDQEYLEEEAREKLIRKLNAHQGDPTPILPELWKLAEKTNKRSYTWYYDEDETVQPPYLLLLSYSNDYPQHVATHLKKILKNQGLTGTNAPTKESSAEEILAHQLIRGMKSPNEPTADLCMALLPSVGEYAIPMIPIIEEAYHHRAMCTSYPSYHARDALFKKLPDEVIQELSQDGRLEYRGFAAAVMIDRGFELDRAFEIGAEVMKEGNPNTIETILTTIRFSPEKITKPYTPQIKRFFIPALTNDNPDIRFETFWLWRKFNCELPPEVYAYHENLVESEKSFERQQAMVLLLDNPAWTEAQKSALINQRLQDRNHRIRRGLLEHLTSILPPPDDSLQQFQKTIQEQSKHTREELRKRVQKANWSEEEKAKVLAVMK